MFGGGWKNLINIQGKLSCPQGSALHAELRALGLSTPASSCSLWNASLKTGSTAATPDALHKALWMFMGAVSAARIAASSLMDARL